MTAYTIIGTAASEILFVANCVSAVKGKGVDAWFCVNIWKDILRGGLGNDTLMGWVENDIFIVGIGNDHLDGGIGNGILKGNYGYDVFYGLSSLNILKVKVAMICYTVEAITTYSMVIVARVFCWVELDMTRSMAAKVMAMTA